MKIIFEGLARAMYSHKHETALKWRNATQASGTLHSLGLSGDFSINLEFQVEELEQWMTKYLETDPAGALRLASRIQAEAIYALSTKSKS
jgi:hypothetical protein